MQLFVNKDGYAQRIVKKKVTGCKPFLYYLLQRQPPKESVYVYHKEAQITKCLQCQFRAGILD